MGINTNIPEFALNVPDGSMGTGSVHITMEIDLNRDGNYVPLCINDYKQDNSLTTTSVQTTCTRGQKIEFVTGIETTYSGGAYVTKGSAMAELWSRRGQAMVEFNDVPVRFTDTLAEDETTVKVAISNFGQTGAMEDLMEFSFEMKPSSTPQIRRIREEPTTPEIL